MACAAHVVVGGGSNVPANFSDPDVRGALYYAFIRDTGSKCP